MRKPWTTGILRVLLSLVALQVAACGTTAATRDERPPAAAGEIQTPDCTSGPGSAVLLGDYSEQSSAGTKILFNDAVGEIDRGRVIEGLDAVRDYLSGSGVALPESVCVDVRVTESGLAGSANATASHIIIFTTTDGWPMTQAWHLQMVTAHEYVHAWQYEASGETPLSGPTWLIEGSAQLIAFRAMVEAGILSKSEALSLLTRPTGSLVPSLESLETPESFNVVNSPYGLASAAVDVLTAQTGVAALQIYWHEIGAGVPWQAAFLHAFGVTPEAFYKRFEVNPALGFGVRPH